MLELRGDLDQDPADRIALESRSSTISQRHIPALDGLRGLAILLVLIHHFTPGHPSDWGANPDPAAPEYDQWNAIWGVVRWFHLGWVGVDLFFVLSGFLITSILLETKPGRHYFRNFYVRRVLRIFPLYYAFLFVLFVVIPAVVTVAGLWPTLHARLGAQMAQYERNAAHQWWLWLYAGNLATAFRGIHWGFAGHTWSLAVEEHFYLIWPVVVWLCSPRALRWVCLGCIGGALALRLALLQMGAQPLTVYVLTPCRMEGLAYGGLLALLLHEGTALPRVMRFAGPLGVLCGLVFLAGYFASGDPEHDSLFVSSVGYSLVAIFFGAVVLYAVQAPVTSVAGRIFTARPLRTLGKYSYGIYLLHRPLGLPLRMLVPIVALANALGSPVAALLVFYACVLLVSLSAAVISWNVLEVHFLKLKKYFV